VPDDENVLNYLVTANPELKTLVKNAGCSLEAGDIVDIGIAFSPKQQAKSLKALNLLNETIKEMIKSGDMQKLADKYQMKKWW
jgi:ABC-type amino acid transport substrate-binding protein